MGGSATPATFGQSGTFGKTAILARPAEISAPRVELAGIVGNDVT